MNNKGFFLLESLFIFSLGIVLILACLQVYNACLVTMQKKLLLEKAIIAANLYLAEEQSSSIFQIHEVEVPTTIENLKLKEVQVKYEDKLVFTLTTTQ